MANPYIIRLLEAQARHLDRPLDEVEMIEPLVPQKIGLLLKDMANSGALQHVGKIGEYDVMEGPTRYHPTYRYYGVFDHGFPVAAIELARMAPGSRLQGMKVKLVAVRKGYNGLGSQLYLFVLDQGETLISDTHWTSGGYAVWHKLAGSGRVTVTRHWRDDDGNLQSAPITDLEALPDEELKGSMFTMTKRQPVAEARATDRRFDPWRAAPGKIYGHGEYTGVGYWYNPKLDKHAVITWEALGRDEHHLNILMDHPEMFGLSKEWMREHAAGFGTDDALAVGCASGWARISVGPDPAGRLTTNLDAGTRSVARRALAWVVQHHPGLEYAFIDIWPFKFDQEALKLGFGDIVEPVAKQTPVVLNNPDEIEQFIRKGVAARKIGESAPIEAVDPTVAEEAFWWLTRWISGSMDDDEWDDTWTKLKPEQAFEVVAKLVGNRHSIKPLLYRYLVVPKRLADKIIQTKTLPPSKNFFQSFTTSAKIARAEGPKIHGWAAQQPGNVPLLVAAKVPPEKVLFGYQDLKASKLGAAQRAAMETADWAHQNEVLVRVNGPLPLAEVRVLGKAG